MSKGEIMYMIDVAIKRTVTKFCGEKVVGYSLIRVDDGQRLTYFNDKADILAVIDEINRKAKTERYGVGYNLVEEDD